MTRPVAIEERPRPKDAGVSLAELLVAMTIMALVGTLVATMAMVSLRNQTGVEARLQDTTQGELAVSAAGKVLRTAVLPAQLETQTCQGCSSTAIISASATKITFYAYVGNIAVGPSLTTLEVKADALRPGTGLLEQVIQPPIDLGGGRYTFCTRGATSTSSCPFATRVLGRGLLWPSPGVLSYYDYDGLPIPTSTVPSADLVKISSIDLVVKVQARPGNPRYPARTTLTRVRLPNLEYDPNTEESA